MMMMMMMMMMMTFKCLDAAVTAVVVSRNVWKIFPDQLVTI